MNARICPQCQDNTIMDKVTVKDLIIDICPRCKGVYYDRGEMKKALAGSLDAETILSRLPYDGSNLICPACEINMDKISASKGDLIYEMHFCRSCLATFLSSGELYKIRQRLNGSVFRQPSALRPKTIVETTFMHPPRPSGPAPQPSLRPDLSSNEVYSPARPVKISPAEEKNALMHYKNINYEYASEYEPISASSYLFCLFSNLPLEVYNPRYYFPLVLVFIIAANSLVFALTYKLIANASAMGEFSRAYQVLRGFYDTLGLVPAEFLSVKYLLNLFSYQFVHVGLMHFIGNMYFLWVFGDNVCDIFYDRKEAAEREASFLGFYLFTGIIGGLANTFFFYGADIPLIGASGAVAGVMGAYLRLFPGAKFYQVIFFYPFKIPAVYYIGIWVIGQVLMAFFLGAYSSVSWPAHLGGFIAGYMCIDYFIPYSPEEVTPES